METEGKRFLAFTLSVVERAHAYDEDILFQTVEIALRLMPDSLDSFTEVDSIAASIAWTVLVLSGFLLLVWKVVLPRHLTQNVSTHAKV